MAGFIRSISTKGIICPLSLHRTIRRSIMTSPFRAEQALEELKQNPYFEKYAQKITTLQRTSPDELLSRLEKVHISRTTPPESTGTKDERLFSPLAEPKSGTRDPKGTRPKALSDVMKLELVADKTADEIKAIWEEYHKQKDVLAAIVPAEVYDKLIAMSKQFPLFLFPLPRDRGYEFMLCQFAGNEVHYTPLVNYQAHKENAPECLTLVHYQELKDKGVILMRGEYNRDILNAKEALCLTHQLQLYYCQADAKRMKLMERFTYKPDEFQHMDLVAELECLTSSFYINK